MRLIGRIGHIGSRPLVEAEAAWLTILRDLGATQEANMQILELLFGDLAG
jgi:hypothetical protein